MKGADPTLSLVPIHDATCCAPRPRQTTAGLGLGAATLGALSVLAVTVPAPGFWLISSLIVIIATISWNARGFTGASAVNPAEIDSPELAASYRALLASHAELARVVAAEHTGLAHDAALLDRSRDAVVLCGKLAVIASRAERYCALHPAEHAAADAETLRMRAAATTDAETRELLAAAAASSEQRAAAVIDIRRSRDRTAAELEAARAALDALIATLMTRRLADDRALALAAESLATHLGELEADIDARAA